MPIKTIQVFQDTTEETTKNQAPITTTWKGVRFIRGHSLYSACDEILNFMKKRDVCKIGIVGDQSTGKSSDEDTIAHVLHKRSKIPYAVRSFGADDYLDFENVLGALEPNNYILKFRDLSFLKGIASQRQIDLVKRAITVIRHLKQDVKIILVYDYHYTLGLDKYLRQADFRIFTSVADEEEDNILRIVGNKWRRTVKHFKKLMVECTAEDKATFPLKKGLPPIIYEYMNPFTLVLFWNRQRLRFIIIPLRTWIDPFCEICSLGDTTIKEQVDIPKFISETEKKFGVRTLETAVKLKALENGIHTFSPNVENCLKYLTKAVVAKTIPLEKLLAHYGLTPTRTKLKKYFDGVLTEEKPEKEDSDKNEEKSSKQRDF